MHHSQSCMLKDCGQDIRSEKDKLQSVIKGKRYGTKLTLNNMKQIYQSRNISMWMDKITSYKITCKALILYFLQLCQMNQMSPLNVLYDLQEIVNAK